MDQIVQVIAEALYEDFALGLAFIRNEDWVNGIAEGLNTANISVKNQFPEGGCVLPLADRFSRDAADCVDAGVPQLRLRAASRP